MLRYVDRTQATIWVETDRRCRVHIRAGEQVASADTWSVHGHHYALLVLEGFEPGTVAPYTVDLDDERVWPQADSPYPPSVIRTLSSESRVRLSFGSCRRVGPFDEEGLKEFGADALAALAETMRDTDHEQWPDALFMAGDQIYADEPSPQLVQRLLTTHDPTPPGREDVADEVWNFEEYTWLYDESWSPAPVRWLLSTVPTCMLLDDHDLRDDWNTSLAWREEVTQTAWWRDRVVGAFASYWVYQHLGNLSPEHLAQDPMYALVREAADDDARTAELDDFAWRTDAEVGTTRWSFVRDFGDEQVPIRLVAMDCRASRHLEPGERAMVDAGEWEWIVEQATHGPDGRPIAHLLLGSTLPVLLPRGIHHLEGWNEAWASGRYGARAEALAERVRQLVDLEHWSAFRTSFAQIVELLRRVSSAPTPPRSVLILSGDVHCSYIADAHLVDTPHPGTVIRQLTMSPFRNSLPVPIKIVNRLFERKPLRALTRLMSRASAVPDTGLDWALDAGPWFQNGVMTIVLDGPTATLEVDKAEYDGTRQFLQRSGTFVLTTPVVEGAGAPAPTRR